MGMFDWVNAPAITCDCGEVIGHWQSKDGHCDGDTIDLNEVNHYYSMCRACGMWHEFVREEPEPRPPFKHHKKPTGIKSS